MLSQIDSRLLQETINKIYVDNSFSKNYIARILKVIKGSFKYACYSLNLINENPAERVHAPRMNKIDKDPVHIFTQEEMEKILKNSEIEKNMTQAELAEKADLSHDYIRQIESEKIADTFFCTNSI